MNWVTTNIRFPEDRYMELKMMAAQSRKSIAELVRNGVEMIIKKKNSPKRPNVAKLLKELNKLAKENARQNPGLDLTKALIEMRYEQ